LELASFVLLLSRIAIPLAACNLYFALVRWRLRALRAFRARTFLPPYADCVLEAKPQEIALALRPGFDTKRPDRLVSIEKRPEK
jgi:hypothetical protein